MRLVILFFFLLGCHCAYAQNANINNFNIVESSDQPGSLAILTTDSLEQPKKDINGRYTFSISGFTQVIDFKDGVGIIPLKLEKSIFVYVKHENETGVHSKLVYVVKNEFLLKPIVISRIFFIIIPLLILLVCFAFKRFIYIGIILLVIFMYFNHAKGLNISTYLETLVDYLKNLV